MLRSLFGDCHFGCSVDEVCLQKEILFHRSWAVALGATGARARSCFKGKMVSEKMI